MAPRAHPHHRRRSGQVREGWPARGIQGTGRRRLSGGGRHIVFAYEASRLARSNADWYALLDLAAVFGTLIADVDGVYNPTDYNDRLLLGLRGMLSEAELHLHKLRLDAGKQRQIEQGTYRQLLPTGLVRLEDGGVVKDPDAQVRHAIELVFERFKALGSCQKVLRSLRDEGILIPRRQTGGLHAGELLWKRPSESAIYEILRNPAYAGAFVFGRTAAHPDCRPGQRGRAIRLPVEEWPVIHHGVYPAYISWEQFLANRQRMSENASRYEKLSRGAPRQGGALLAGLVVCGHCGRQAKTAYKPKSRYVCNSLGKTHAGAQCLHLEGESIEKAVVGAFFEALEPAELDLLEEVIADQRADRERMLRQQAEQVERAEYEVRLAERQYMAVDPENRLVAAELERRWEQALRALTEAREAAERAQRVRPPVAELEPDLRAQLEDLGGRLPELWESGRLTHEHKKELLRTLIRHVILTRPIAERVEVKIVWISGAFSELTVRPKIQKTVDLEDYDLLVGRISELSADGYDDLTIAYCLTSEGFHGARGEEVGQALVGRIRRANGLASLREEFRRKDRIGGRWTIAGLARELKAPNKWLYAQIERGVLPATRHPITGNFLVPDDPAVLGRIRSLLVSERREENRSEGRGGHPLD
jgi:DNA invertase Pin-like site-specific DNA recombinase